MTLLQEQTKSLITQHGLVELLETIVDKDGLLHVLTALELMCREKAEHIRTNWQDEESAKEWSKMGAAIYKASHVAAKYDI